MLRAAERACRLKKQTAGPFPVGVSVLRCALKFPAHPCESSFPCFLHSRPGRFSSGQPDGRVAQCPPSGSAAGRRQRAFEPNKKRAAGKAGRSAWES
ncbi:MAG: hypothetical protein DBY17_04465 [Oscillospiraceae bacterium]|nr:MAG: hypothetical protein DBY17_04465 [Oscillospiraceae bacterium]